MDLSTFWEIFFGLIPPTLMGVIIYVLMRSIFRADSKERKVYAQMEAQIRAERAAEKALKNPK